MNKDLKEFTDDLILDEVNSFLEDIGFEHTEVLKFENPNVSKFETVSVEIHCSSVEDIRKSIFDTYLNYDMDEEAMEIVLAHQNDKNFSVFDVVDDCREVESFLDNLINEFDIFCW